MRELLVLAAPLVAGHAGNQLMSFVDAAMVGRLGPTSLAAVGIGNGLYLAFTIFGMGCVLGMDAPVAQAIGAGEHARARSIYGQGVRVALLVGVPLMIVIALMPFILGPAGVEPDVARATRDFTWARTAGVIPFLIFAASRSYLQATHHMRPIVMAMIVANVVNFVGNALFIYGDRSLAALGLPGIGLPALGVLGSGLSSSLAAVASLIVLRGAIDRAGGVDQARRGADPQMIRRIFRIGTPVGAQMLAEVGIFATAGVLAGRLGKTAAASHQISLTLASFTFTVTLGLASATSVRVGKAIGRGDTPAARRAGFTGLKAAAMFMTLAALTFLVIPGPLARILTTDASVISAAGPLLMIAAVFQLSDGLQVVGAGALRGAGDTHAPMIANLVGYYVIALPIAIGLGFGLHMGAPGLWWGLSAGLTAVAIALVARFAWLSARTIQRV